MAASVIFGLWTAAYEVILEPSGGAIPNATHPYGPYHIMLPTLPCYVRIRRDGGNEALHLVFSPFPTMKR